MFVRTLVSLENDSAEARDSAVNTFHFVTSVPDDEEAILDDLDAALESVYDALGPILSPNISGNVRFRHYDLRDAPPRFPVRDTLVTIPVTATNGLPNEVAWCVSYEGLVESGINRRRNRGRIYLGPLSSGVSSDSVGDMRPNTGSTDIVVAAFSPLLPEVPSPTFAGTINWTIFSRANALGLAVGAPPPANEPDYTDAQLAAGTRNVVSAYVDDAFDTQRRRGLRPTLRSPIT